MFEIKLRVGGQSDNLIRREVISQAFRQAYGHFFTKEELDNMFANPLAGRSEWAKKREGRVSTLLATCESEIVGTMSVVKWNDHNAEMSSLYVRPDYQRGNVGRRLWDACIDMASEEGIRTLYVYTFSKGHAIPFYKKMGCVECGVSKYHVGNHSEEVLILSKAL